MKTRNCGGKFLSQDNGQGPRGRNMTALVYQKGQAKEDRCRAYFLCPNKPKVECL